VTDRGCRKCDGDWPDERYRIAELPTSVAYLHEDQYFVGWSVLVLKRHATELWELPPGERAQLMEDVTALARALADELAPVKMNYELLGNQVAHIHWHLIPRLAGDPVSRMPVWVHDHPRRVPTAAERVDRIARLRQRLTT
jgi:diadenosine tetraphosphate (Ap4A) HIT family hydrolase